MRTLFSCVAGSQLYGTDTPNSDRDIRGVYLENWKFILGLHKQDHIVETKDQDRTDYSLRFFSNLLLDANPNILELIFVSKKQAIDWTTDWQYFRLCSDYALSQKVRHTFAGYALSQLKKINTHYKWMTGKPPEKPLPEDYGQVATYSGETWVDYNLKQEYDADKKTYENYANWLKQRNPARHELEAKYGYDTKNGLHLVRLLTEAEDILSKGFIEFPLHNARFLLEVKNGYFTYPEIIKWSDEYFEKIKNMPSVLPNKPNVNEIEDMVMKIYWEYVR